MSPTALITQLRSADAAASFAVDASRFADVVDASFPPLARMEYESDAEDNRVFSADAAVSAMIVDEGVGEEAEAAKVDEDVEEVVVVVVDDEFGDDSVAKAAAAEVEGDEVFGDAVSAFLKDLEVLELGESLGSLGEVVDESDESRDVASSKIPLTFEIPGISSFGRERASATTFALPCT